MPAGRQSHNAGPPDPLKLLNEAETLQQRAERKKGNDATSALEAAADMYHRALDAGLGPPQRLDAMMGIGECLAAAAAALVEAVRGLPDERVTWEAEAAAQQAATSLYERAVAAYEQVTEPEGVRVDAAVDAGNALCAWAELVAEPGAAVPLMLRAVEAYRYALGREEDALTLSNLADALVQLGEAQLSTAAGTSSTAAVDTAAATPQASPPPHHQQQQQQQQQQHEEGLAALAAALEAYERSCSLTDSSAGDDLPGLLHNWGCGLYAVSKHVQDPRKRASLLEQAAQRLRSSAAFNRADPAPHNALGDALLSRAELSTPLGESREAAAAWVRAAEEEGFQAALTLKRTNADALVGLAEAAVASGRLAAAAGDAAAAAVSFARACHHYGAALQHSTQLGSISERCDVRYNFACACALAGRAAEAATQLEALAAAGALRAADLAADADLAGLHDQQWWETLLRASRP